MNALGDFQTPAPLAALVLDALRARGLGPARVLEPTCGSGTFLAAAAAAFPAAELVGIEYQRERYAAALEPLGARLTQLTIRYANAYELDFARLPWRASGPLLVVGNPPWVTAAALGRAGTAAVQPPRSNARGLRGLAARTGASNFDVAEFLVLKLLADYRAEPIVLALLVKESVARNVLAAADAGGLRIAGAEIVRIDARRWFGVAVDACCLIVHAAPAARSCEPAIIRADFGGAPVEVAMLVRRITAAPGAVRFRQGIKHDAANVFELRHSGDGWANGYGEHVDVEPEYVYPLLKARALHVGEGTSSGRTLNEATALIVPQQHLGAPTDVLAARAPRLWRYLCLHAARIDARKSSIYRQAPRFAIFGVGPYSFAPWKVAVAGLYPQPRFRVVGPRAGRPVVFGDTSYFAAFEDEAGARAFAACCTSNAAAAIFAQRVVRGKRPITQALLEGIDWLQIAADLDRSTNGLQPQRSEALTR